MKLITKIFLATFLLFSVTTIVTAQELDKKEKKSIKKQLKKYKKNPAQYRSMIDGYQADIKDRDKEIADLKAKLKNCQNSVSAKNDSIEYLKSMIAKLSNQIAELEKSAGNLADLPEGKAYAVQIGYYNAFDITEYFSEAKLVTYEKTGDGGNKYMVYYFNDENNAERFAEDIRKLGISDAWVAHYVDGIRINKDTGEPENATVPTNGSSKINVSGGNSDKIDVSGGNSNKIDISGGQDDSPSGDDW